MNGPIRLFMDGVLIPSMVRAKQQERRPRLACQLSGQPGLVAA